MNYFVARYIERGRRKSMAFDKSVFDKDKAINHLNEKGINNFMFFFEPNEPEPIGDNGILFSGDVGFDITSKNIMHYVNQNKDIVLDTFGGDNWEALKIHDLIKESKKNPSIGIIGNCMSAGMQILLSTENRWMSHNSRGLIHNPWSWMQGDDRDFRLIADDLEKEKLQIANIYSKVSGKPLDYILNIMRDERILRYNEMMDLNFVKRIGWSDDELINVNTNLEMNEQEKEKLNVIEKVVNSIKEKLFDKPKVNNLIVQDVNGVELDFGNEVETMEQVEIGASATANGEPANGEYVMPDGKTYVFENGILSEIKEPETVEDVEALKSENEQVKAENEQLTNQVENLKNKVNEKEQFVKDLQNQFDEVNTRLNELKQLAADEEPAVNIPETEKTQSKTKFSYNKNKK